MTIIIPGWALAIAAIYLPISLALDVANLYYRRKLNQMKRTP